MNDSRNYPPPPPAPDDAAYDDADVQALRAVILEGLNSPVDGVDDDDDFFARLATRAAARPEAPKPR